MANFGGALDIQYSASPSAPACQAVSFLDPFSLSECLRSTHNGFENGAPHTHRMHTVNMSYCRLSGFSVKALHQEDLTVTKALRLFIKPKALQVESYTRAWSVQLSQCQMQSLAFSLTSSVLILAYLLLKTEEEFLLASMYNLPVKTLCPTILLIIT